MRFDASLLLLTLKIVKQKQPLQRDNYEYTLCKIPGHRQRFCDDR